jgi:predicted DNA-binding transcriptional regulator AlpA
MSNPTVSSDAAAKLLGLATSTLAKLRLSGSGPLYCKLGRRVVYRMEDLEAWLESRVARNTSDADARLPKSLTGDQLGITGSPSENAPDIGIRPRQASTRKANTDPAPSKTVPGKNSKARRRD